MINFPYISVVVCAYNEEKLLDQCIEGLVNQSFPKNKYEILIVDDESSDKTPKTAQKWVSTLKEKLPRFTYIRIAHGGLSVARNTGIKHAQGDIIAFIDGDALASRDWLSELTKAFYKNNVDYVGGKIELLNHNSSVARLAQLTRHKQVFGPNVFLNNLVGCNMAYRKEIFEAFGGFYENFTSRGDETSLQNRIEASFHFAPAPNAVIYHERPETFRSWIKTEWKEATLNGIIRKMPKQKNKVRRKLALFESAMFVFLPLALVIPLVTIWGILGLIGSILATIRRLLFRPASRILFSGLYESYGLFRAILIYIFYLYFKSLISLVGGTVGYWKHRKDKLVEPMSTEARILVLEKNL